MTKHVKPEQGQKENFFCMTNFNSITRLCYILYLWKEEKTDTNQISVCSSKMTLDGFFIELYHLWFLSIMLNGSAQQILYRIL